MTERLHAHPQNPNNFFWGQRLAFGDIIHEDDVYASEDGTWQKTPCTGLTVREACFMYISFIWVRPRALPKK